MLMHAMGIILDICELYSQFFLKKSSAKPMRKSCFEAKMRMLRVKFANFKLKKWPLWRIMAGENFFDQKGATLYLISA